MHILIDHHFTWLQNLHKDSVDTVGDIFIQFIGNMATNIVGFEVLEYRQKLQKDSVEDCA